MELNRTQIILFLIFILTLSSCGLYRSSQVNAKAFDELENPILVRSANSAFPIPDIPESIKDGQERAVYLSKHYWDEFSFNDTSLISKPEITEQGFVDYIHILNYISFNHARKSLRIMLYKARENPAMLAHFGSLFQKYYYDANSPFRNEELYIPVLESLLSSSLLSEADHEKYDFQEEMIHKNRVGTKAANFVYTLPDGSWKKMHAYKSDYLILLFIKPECKVCEEIKNEIENSETLKEVFSRNSFSRSMLTVLTVYPDDDIDLWRKSLPEMPQKNWLHTYDNGMIITHKRVYDIKTIPTMHFLNRNKKILLKDTSVEEIESYFMKGN